MPHMMLVDMSHTVCTVTPHAVELTGDDVWLEDLVSDVHRAAMQRHRARM